MIRTLVMLAFLGGAASRCRRDCAFPGLCSLAISGFFTAWQCGARGPGCASPEFGCRPSGSDKLDPARTYIFMSNHVSNIDPPILMPLIPRRTSVMVKKELFNVPDPGQDDAPGIAGSGGSRESRRRNLRRARAAADVIRQGINMTIYVEGHRSFDGKLAALQERPVLPGRRSAVCRWCRSPSSVRTTSCRKGDLPSSPGLSL